MADKHVNKITPEDLKELKDKFYLHYRAPDPLDRIKRWRYGEKKLNRLILEQRDTNA